MKIENPDETLKPRQARFLDRLLTSRLRLLAGIENLSEQTITLVYIYGDWTIKDIFGHLVSWDEEFRLDIRTILQGQHPGYERLISGSQDFTEWNLTQRSLKGGWGWHQIRNDFDRDFAEASQLIRSLQPGDFRRRGVTPWKQAAFVKPEILPTEDTESVETLVTYHWRHWNQHAGWIERWRKKNE
jgi:hypothetical protein